jgi:hypothetical protein
LASLARSAATRPAGSKSRLRSRAPALFLLSFPFFQGFGFSPPQQAYLETLKTIYAEVKEMGVRPGENFVQRDFFIGAPDEDDTNKDIYVNIFIQTVAGTEKMRIQVTYMERTKENSKIKLAKKTRELTLFIGADAVRIERSDYDEGELPKLAEDILKAVKDKKRLLKK